jgi:polyisoprenoid-binding protein YceI
VRTALFLLALLSSPGAAQTLALDPSTGSLRALLYKDGPLRALGHDHVVRVPAFSGTVEFASGTARLELAIDAAALLIDEDRARADEGMAALKKSDVEKITDGMRGPKGLDVSRHPKITFRSTEISPVADEKDLWQVAGKLSLHGVERELDFPVSVSEGPGGRWFTGYVRLRPSEFGVKPFSVFLGAVKLKDEAFVRFTLLAK